MYALDASSPDEDVRCLIKRDENIECYIDHWQDFFYAMRSSRENKEYMVCYDCGAYWSICYVCSIIKFAT